MYFKDELSMLSARYRLRDLNSAMASLTSSKLIDCRVSVLSVNSDRIARIPRFRRRTYRGIV